MKFNDSNKQSSNGRKEEFVRKRNQVQMRVKGTHEEILESELEEKFFELINETDQTIYENVWEKLEETNFDSFAFVAIIDDSSLPFMMYKLLSMYKIIIPFQIPLKKLVDFSGIVQKGYFDENPYHNTTHIVDTLQAMHYLYFTANFKKYLKKGDLLASFLANLIHDYEHPGYNNQFIVRTKHPLALRYNDQSVLENHHLAASFTLLYQEEYNFLENLSTESMYELRKIVITTVLNTDLSFHFNLLTELKIKLDKNFPSDLQEDKNLVISLALKISDMFKIVRNYSTKWMEKMFEEFFLQSDMEKNLDLPIILNTTNREKAYLNYVEVVWKPLFVTFLIMADDDIKKEVIEEGIDKNKKNYGQEDRKVEG